MKYKLIVSDMDGTLLGDNHKITEENKRKQEIVLWKIKILKKCVDFDFWMWYNNIALE